jgi:hypothetical protein
MRAATSIVVTAIAPAVTSSRLTSIAGFQETLPSLMT